MKLLNKLENLKLSKKILLFILTTIIIAVFNFLFYNYQSLKLNKENRNYKIDLKDSTSEKIKKETNDLLSVEDNSVLQVNLEDNYIKYLNIQYETADDFTIKYTGQVANDHGKFIEYEKEDNCYASLNNCGINISHRVRSLNLNFDIANIKILEINVDNSLRFNWITFLFWEIFINLIILLIFFKSYFFEKKHILAFIICLSIGTVLLTCTHNMTTTTLDDDTHFGLVNSLNKMNRKASQTDLYLEQGQMRFYNQDTPQEKKDFQNLMNTQSKVLVESNLSSSNMLATNRINYLPMAITLKILNMLGLPMMTSFFLTRVVQLIIYAIIIMFAVKLMPNFKLLTLILGIIPQSLFLATNFSYDPTVTACLMLAFAAFSKEYYNKDKKINKINILVFILASLYGSFPKAIYAFILLLMLLLPKEKFANQKQYNIFRFLILSLFILCLMTFFMPMLFDTSIMSDTRGGDVSGIDQLKLIIKQPVSFIKTFWTVAILETPNRLFGPSTFGLLSYYGGMEIDYCYFLILLAILISFISEKKQINIKVKDKISMLIIYGLIICSIWGAMYLAFTPYGDDGINGVQARYFIPLLLPIFYSFQTKNLINKISEEKSMIICLIFCILAIIGVLYSKIIIEYCL